MVKISPEHKLALSKKTSLKTRKSRKSSTESTESTELKNFLLLTNSNFQESKEEQDCYALNTDILVKSKISQKNRAKLKNWFIYEGVRQFCQRETLALSIYYLDMFLSGNEFPISDFQILGLACFSLAAKTVEGKSPNISYNVFDKHILIQMEKQVCFKLNFRLSPQTYISIIDNLMWKWDSFNSKKNIFNTFYFKQSDESYFMARYLYEILDCMNMVISTNRFKLNQFVLNVFFLENRINCTQITRPTNKKQFLNKFYKKDKYWKIFQQFIEDQETFLDFQMSKQIGQYIFQFYGLQKQMNLPMCKITCMTHIEYMSQQTINKSLYAIALKVIEKISASTKDL